MRHRYKALIAFLAMSTLLTACGNGRLKKEVSEKLHHELSSMGSDSASLKGNALLQADLITEMYQKGQPFLSPKWGAQENARQLLDAIKGVGQEGLNPEDYHLSSIERLMEEIARNDSASAQEIAHLELLLTDAFLLLASHLAAGKTDARNTDPQWHAARRELPIDWPGFTDSVLTAKAVEVTLKALVPGHSQYKNLRKALSKYKQIQVAGGWTSIHTNEKKLERGMLHPDVALLRNRLSKTQGKIEEDSENPQLFDSTLQAQLVIFQRRNGLTPDGVLGPKTLEALNIPVEDRIAAIEANLERWRWIKDSLGVRHIMVNIADFSLRLIENQEIIFETEAIVGKSYRKTPVFSAVMTYMVVNPDWTVPPTILKNDVIPEVLKDARYLAKKNMKVYSRDGRELDPSTINWQQAASSHFPYTIRQDPGKTNALGKIKFMFPNEYNVYIHDTPARELFALTERTFSSGCIRINRPIEFAKVLLKGQKSVTPDQLDLLLQQADTKTIQLESPVAVHVIYLTAWADDEGIAYFRRDVYDRDGALLEALKRPYLVSGEALN